MAFSYNAHEHTLIGTALRFQHTVWPNVLTSCSFWIFLALHLCLWLSFRYQLIDKFALERGFHLELSKGLLSVSWDDMKVISTITTFFEVFYTQQCYSRYLALNAGVNQIFRTCHQFVFENKQTQCGLVSPELGASYLRLTTRWMHAHLVFFFMELRHGPLHSEHWQQIREVGLLNPNECAFLERFTSPQRGFLLLDWTCKVSIAGFRLSESPVKGNAQSLINKIIAVDEAGKHVMDLIRMPVPFQYFHMLNLMVVMNLCLWCYGMAMTESVYGPLVYLFALFIFIGMLELANAFSDPFGDDDVDFPIHIWLEKFFENQLAFLEYEFSPARDGFQMALSRAEKLAWEPGAMSGLVGNQNDDNLGNAVMVHRASLVTHNYQPLPTKCPEA